MNEVIRFFLVASVLVLVGCASTTGLVPPYRPDGAATSRHVFYEDRDVRTQVIGVDGDGSVSNRRVVQPVDYQQQAGRLSACIYEQGVPHSMFSRSDHPGEDMYWLASFESDTIAFVVAGTPFPTDGDSADGENIVPRCALDGDASAQRQIK